MRAAAASHTASTIGFYQRNADRYFEDTLNNDVSEFHRIFEEKLPRGGRILDAGCGSGRDSLHFKRQGYDVDAFDASAELARRASSLTGIAVEVQQFETWSGSIDSYDGIWAFASLLHVDAQTLPGALERLSAALKPGGTLFASFKHGVDTTVDAHGRRFTNLTIASANRLINSVPQLSPIRIWAESGPASLGATATWLYILAQKQVQD